MDSHFSDNAHNWRRVSHRIVLGAALVPVLLASGCSEKWAEVFPVAGSVKFDGKAPVGAQIVLHPVNPASPEAVAPTGKVKSDGSFQITSYQAGDGAPPGDYVATIQWFQVDKDGIVGANVIPKEYSTPTTSPIKVTVNAGGPTQLEPITITAGKQAARGGTTARR
jgi:hypothetical protein